MNPNRVPSGRLFCPGSTDPGFFFDVRAGKAVTAATIFVRFTI